MAGILTIVFKERVMYFLICADFYRQIKEASMGEMLRSALSFYNDKYLSQL